MEKQFEGNAGNKELVRSLNEAEPPVEKKLNAPISNDQYKKLLNEYNEQLSYFEDPTKLIEEFNKGFLPHRNYVVIVLPAVDPFINKTSRLVKPVSAISKEYGTALTNTPVPIVAMGSNVVEVFDCKLGDLALINNSVPIEKIFYFSGVRCAVLMADGLFGVIKSSHIEGYDTKLEFKDRV